jgi:hypothetical protein
VSRGLAQMDAPDGTLISFATQPGNVALDGEDGDSPYTKALTQVIKRPGLGIFEVFNQVGLDVKKRTGGAQQPWVSHSPIDGSFYFSGLAEATPPTQAPTGPLPKQVHPSDVGATTCTEINRPHDPKPVRLWLRSYFSSVGYVGDYQAAAANIGAICQASPSWTLQMAARRWAENLVGNRNGIGIR